MNTDEMKRLADIIYPGKEWFSCPEGVMRHDDSYADGYEHFHPSLTGNAGQRLKALDVIVAASKINDSPVFHCWDGKCSVSWIEYKNDGSHKQANKATAIEPDILSAACAALLSQEGR